MASVTITQGGLRGSIQTTEGGVSYEHYLGIPYAKPPVGNLRFKNPEPPESWDGERDATIFDAKNKKAIQKDIIKNIVAGSEDCLYLNVFTPRLRNSKTLLPVMVNIHGGGFVVGSGTDLSIFGPDYLIENNVVIVSLNHRLNIFGFLNLGIPAAAGNMGLKDQVKALEWVKDNISAFGGDTNNVTIFGGSAGSASVEYLLLSPLAKGLYHKAILQSGSCLNHWAINYEPKMLINKVLNSLQYKTSYDDTEAVYEFLMKVPQVQLVEAAAKVTKELSPYKLFFGFVPTIEKDFGTGREFLTVHPYKLMKEGNFTHVPMIRGFSNSEGIESSVLKPEGLKIIVTNKSFLSVWPYEIDSDFDQKLLTAYSVKSKISDEPDQFAIDFYTDFDFAAGIWLANKMMTKEGIPTYFYLFTYDGDANAYKAMLNVKRKGAGHCDEASYIFKMSIMPNTKLVNLKDILMKTILTRMWTDFARTGNPTPAASTLVPLWPEFTEKSPLYLNIGKELVIGNDYEPKKMAVFKEIYIRYEKYE